jgi:UDP-3-O-[3-hydroxymyristoyl] glucosamine N-acyltransferase
MRLREIADALGCELHGDGDIAIDALAPIDHAGPGDLTFVANPRYERHLATTGASAVLLAKDAPAVRLPSLRADAPYLAFAQALRLFHRPPVQPVGIHPTAVIAADAVLGENCSIGPHAVVGAAVRIGRDAVLAPHVVVYPQVSIGDRFLAHAHVTIREGVVIGDDVTLHAGAVIGSDGFGFVPTPAGDIEKLAQIGNVVIEDGVEIGANATVDRATIGSTVLRKGVKLDNLVMVAHGCEIGANSMLAAQVGLSGSTRLGAWVRVGGQAGFAGHIRIGDGAQIAAQSGVANDVAPGATLGGTPAIDVRLWRRISAALLRLPELLRRVRRLESPRSEPAQG